MGSNASPNAPGGGGSTSPGGSSHQIQFNNAGAFAGDPNLNWIASAQSVAIGNSSTAFANFYNRVDTASGIMPFAMYETRRDTPVATYARYGMTYTTETGSPTNGNVVAAIDIGVDSFGYGEISFKCMGTPFASMTEAMKLDRYGVLTIYEGLSYQASNPLQFDSSNYPDSNCWIQINAGAKKCIVYQTTPYYNTDVFQVQSGANGSVISGCGSTGVFYTGSSTTASRPSVSQVGSIWFDATLGKLICWKGSVWVDAMGNTV